MSELGPREVVAAALSTWIVLWIAWHRYGRDAVVRGTAEQDGPR